MSRASAARIAGRNESMKSLAEVMKDIAASIERKKANFGLTREGDQIVIAAGSYRAIRARTGYIVTIGIAYDQLLALRDTCNELLGANNALKEHREAVKRICRILAESGCECEFDDAHDGQRCEDLGHEPCFGCRVERALGITKPENVEPGPTEP